MMIIFEGTRKWYNHPHWPSPTSVSKFKRTQNLKMSALMLFKETSWFACKPRLDVSIETQKYSDVYKSFARTMQFSHPPLVSLAGETDGRRHGTRNFASQDFFCTKMSSPPSHMMLSLPLRHNFASNLSHFVTNLMQNLGASLAYIFVLWYYVIIVI